MPNRKKKLLVFLSHASEDKPLVRQLYKRLLADGFDPWLDEIRLLPGQDLHFEIEQALQNSDSILVCFSARSTAKEGYIQREYKKAMNYQLEKPEGSIFVIPVRLDDCEIPFFLRELQCVDYPAGYEKLVLSLNLRAGRVSRPRRSSKAPGHRDKTKAGKRKENTRQVQLVLEGSFEEFNETRQEDLVSVLASMLRVDSESIRILQVYSGSIIAVLEIPGIAADRLVELAEKRDFRLKSQGILSIKVEDEPEISLSVRDQEPMLRTILENAVEVLKCEAGAVFLIDESTGAVIWNLTTGPAQNQELGQRLQAEIDRHAAQLRAPVIDNGALPSYSELAGDEKRPGFVPRSYLGVPIKIKDRVLGVIEVINRRDGLPFVEDDQDLLSALAGQAAFAIENARLLGLADEELANQAEERQVMEHIISQLGTESELGRAMQTILEGAMRRSRAKAGLIGMMEGDQLRLMAQQGYDDILTSNSKIQSLLELPAIRYTIAIGQARQVLLVSSEAKGILPSAQSQLVVPIQRETQVIGLILVELESTSNSPENLIFLSYLSHHAAIAIANTQRYEEVRRARLARSDFVSFLAHELKNPVTSVKGYTELLTAGSVGPLNEMQMNFLSTIRANVERMSTLISELDDISRIEAGRLSLNFKPVDVTELVDTVVRAARRGMEEKHQSMEVQVPAQLPLVRADRLRMDQVLTHLVSNAHEYSPEGAKILVGAELSSSPRDPEGANQSVHLWVRDNGIGISTEDQEKIFQKFFRSEDPKVSGVRGTGLGLTISKSLVEMMGGQIWYESEYGRGTTFHVTIPVHEE